MKKELDYFWVENSYGGNQDWFSDLTMKMGGCAALAACESCIYLQRNKGKEGLYPFDVSNITKEDYIKFALKMKPYLRPRFSGIDRLEIYIEGFSNYLSNCGKEVHMEPFSGTQNVVKAKKVLQEQIDKGFLVPCLMLQHKHPSMENYDWHWFLLTGYETYENTYMVKAVTYGSFQWIDFELLWDTGYVRKGGLILYQE